MSRNFVIHIHFLPVLLLPMNSAILHFYFLLIFFILCIFVNCVKRFVTWNLNRDYNHMEFLFICPLIAL